MITASYAERVSARKIVGAAILAGIQAALLTRYHDDAWPKDDTAIQALSNEIDALTDNDMDRWGLAFEISLDIFGE